MPHSLVHGREKELAALERFAEGNADTPILVVHGPPGIGRSALLVRFAARHRGRAVLAESFPPEDPVQMLMRLHAALSADRAGVVDDRPPESFLALERWGEAVAKVLRVRPVPAVLILDGLDEMPDTAREALQAVVAHLIDDGRTRVILAADKPEGTSLALGPLDAEAMTHLGASRLPPGVLPVAGGNPLALRCLLELHESGVPLEDVLRRLGCPQDGAGNRGGGTSEAPLERLLDLLIESLGPALPLLAAYAVAREPLDEETARTMVPHDPEVFARARRLLVPVASGGFRLLHPALAERIRRHPAAGEARTEVLAFCRMWPFSFHPYALRQNPCHLREAIADGRALPSEMYVMAKSARFCEAQRSYLPCDPWLPFRAQELAMRLAAEQGDALELARLAIERVERWTQTCRAIPIQALLDGDCEQVRRYAEIVDDPTAAVLYLTLAAYALDDGRETDARTLLACALERSPRTLGDKKELVDFLAPRLVLLEPDTVATLLEQMYPSHAAHRRLYGLASVLAERGREEEARKIILRLDDTCGTHARDLAHALAAVGRVREALLLLKDLEHEYLNYPPDHLLEVCLDMGLFEEAVKVATAMKSQKHWLHLIEAAPASTGVPLMRHLKDPVLRAQALRHLVDEDPAGRGEWLSALERLVREIAEESDHEARCTLLSELGAAQARAGDSQSLLTLERARKEVRRVRKGESRARALYEHALCREAAGDRQGAISDLVDAGAERLRKSEPDQVRRVIARHLVEMGEDERARGVHPREASEAIMTRELQAGRWEAAAAAGADPMLLARRRQQAGDLEGALAEVQRALKESSRLGSLCEIADLLEDWGCHAQALDVLEQARAAAPEPFTGRQSLMLACAHLGLNAEALALVSNPTQLMMVARKLQARGDSRSALQSAALSVMPSPRPRGTWRRADRTIASDALDLLRGKRIATSPDAMSYASIGVGADDDEDDDGDERDPGDDTDVALHARLLCWSGHPDEALEATLAVDDSDIRDGTLAAIIDAQLGSEQVEAASALIERIGSPLTRADCWLDVARWHASRRAHEAALQAWRRALREAREDGSAQRHERQALMVRDMANEGYGEVAERMLDEVDVSRSPASSARALWITAQAWVRLGQPERAVAAFQAAEECTSANGPEGAAERFLLALAAADAGDVERALRLLESVEERRSTLELIAPEVPFFDLPTIKTVFMKQQVRNSIARSMAAQGRASEARAHLDAWEVHAEAGVRKLVEVVSAAYLARTGDDAAALATAEALHEANRHHEALTAIAVLQAERGACEAAIRTALRIRFDRCYYLPLVLRALATHGTRQDFYRLLIECTDDPIDTAIACDALADLHPEVADEIRRLTEEHFG